MFCPDISIEFSSIDSLSFLRYVNSKSEILIFWHCSTIVPRLLMVIGSNFLSRIKLLVLTDKRRPCFDINFYGGALDLSQHTERGEKLPIGSV